MMMMVDDDDGDGDCDDGLSVLLPSLSPFDCSLIFHDMIFGVF